uniref:Uncharacterized protein n=1 Tax=Arundo donax TaxID=35708 RepID=A0A0A8XNH7_ARUDO
MPPDPCLQWTVGACSLVEVQRKIQGQTQFISLLMVM